jgi:molybdenum cofactor guanylyltransferase
LKDRVSNIAAAVLAGGKNSRMAGINKAFIRIGGATLIQKTLKLLKNMFEEVILVTNSPQDFKSFAKDAIITTDIIKDIGPLGGIHSALSATSKQGVFFVACDMPFLHNALISRQLKYFNRIDPECLVPRIGALIEPLHAIYKKGLRDKINSFVKDSPDYSVRSFLKTTDVCFWDLENNRLNRKIFKNLNTKEDLEKAGGLLCG